MTINLGQRAMMCTLAVVLIASTTSAAATDSRSSVDEVLAESVAEAQRLAASGVSEATQANTSSVGMPRDRMSINAKAMHITCTAVVANAHYSKGAGGAIFKTYVSCNGSGASAVTVQFGGNLSFAPSASSTKFPTAAAKTRASSKYSQVVAVNGPSKAFYTPALGGNGGTGKGFWLRTAVWQIVSPAYGTVGSKTVTNWSDLKRK